MSIAERSKPSRKQHVRTLWISDVHLGTRDCQAERLAAFLKRYQADRVYLVGDIIDGWKLRGGIYWPQAHTNVIRRLLTMSKRGTEVIYVTGNHDEFLRRYSTLILGNIQLVDEAVHTTADGRRLLVVHGDDYDATTHFGNLQEKLGDWLYYRILTGNKLLNFARARLGLRYWSLSEFLKRRSGAAERYIDRFVQACLDDARRRGLDGIVCGHIHRAALVKHEALVYANDGDWVESLTALSEEADGTLCLLSHTGQILADVAPRLRLVPQDVPRAA